MKTILTFSLIALLSGCGIQKDMDKMSSGLDVMKANITGMADSLKKTNGALDSTAKSIKQQTMSVAMNMMFDPNNTKYVDPSSSTPTSMIGPAQMFAEVVEPDDLLGLIYLWTTEVNQSQPISMTPDSQRACDKDKWIKLTAMQIVSALLPQDKIEALIKTEMDSQYASSVFTILSLRYAFITSYILDNGILTAPITTKGGYDAGIQFINALRYIEALPFRDQISVKFFGFFDVDKLGLNQTVAIPKTNVADDYFKKLNANYKQGEKNGTTNAKGN